MRKIYTVTLLVSLVIIGGIMYLIFAPLLFDERRDVDVRGFTLSVPERLLEELDTGRSGPPLSVKKGYVLWVHTLPASSFKEGNFFKNYQRVNEYRRGKIYFYSRNKALFLGFYMIKDENVLVMKFNTRSSVSDWLPWFFKIAWPELTDEERKAIEDYEDNFVGSARMISSYGLGLLLTGIIAFSVLLNLFIMGKVVRKPKNYDEISVEGIIFEKNDVPVSVSSAMSHGSSFVFVVITSYYFRAYVFGRELFKIKRQDLSKYVTANRLIYTVKNTRYSINMKYFQDAGL